VNANKKSALSKVLIGPPNIDAHQLTQSDICFK